MQCYRFYNGRFSYFQKYAHKIPFVVKLNHNELLTYPKYDQIMFGSVRDLEHGSYSCRTTVYFGSAESDRQIIEVARAFEAHSLGMVTILWCYARNNAFVKTMLIIIQQRI
jgi:class I fructose-bisphosphate aldolase